MAAEGERAPLNVFVGIATGRDARWPFPICLAKMFTYAAQCLPQGSGLFLEAGGNFDTAQTRRKLVTRAREEKATHILFLDDDMEFPHDTLVRLASHGKEIVAANYTSRVTLPATPLAQLDGKRVVSRGKTGLERVFFAPTGSMLIDMTVFDRIKKPYFLCPMVDDESDDGISDDVYFCRKAAEAGIETWVDHDLSVKIGHVGQMTFGHEHTRYTETKSLVDMIKEMVK